MKKVLAVALSVIMLLGIIPFAAMAAGEKDFVFDFVASSTEVKAGDVVDVTLNVTGAAGAASVGWQFELDLPEGLEYVDNSAVMNAATKSAINAGEFSFENSTKVMVCCEANGEALKNMEGTNEIMTFQVKVADDAAAGAELTFELIDFLVMDGDAGDLDADKVELNIDTLKVVVDPDFTFDFVASKTNVVAGEVVTITLNVTGVAGAASVGWQFELDLPAGLEFVDNSAVMNAATKSAINAGEFSFENGTKVMVCCEANGEALKNMEGTNEIMTFQVKVADDAVAGDELTFGLIDFLVMDGDAGDLAAELVKLNIDTLTIVDHICSADKLTFVPAADATCTADGNIAYYVCECSLKYTDADATEFVADVIVPATGHTEGEAVVENNVDPDCENNGSYDSVVYCTVCDEELSREEVIVDALGHTKAAESVKENEVAPDCENDGSYDEVVYCDVCGEELSRETITVDALGHDYEAVVTAPDCVNGGYTTYTCTVCGDSYVADETDALGHTEGEVVYENVSDATCTEGGTGDAVVYCSVCGEELSRITSTVPALGHTDGEAVVENNVNPDCVNDGSYDEVVYCTVCGVEVSREEVIVDALGHEEADAVEENRVAADCENDGSYDTVVYCAVCGEELSRETTVIDALGHTEGEVVIENNVAPDCTNEGSYDEVVYCTVCGDELSRDTITVDALGHDYAAVVTAPTCTEQGYTTYTCSVCGDSYVADYVDALGHTAADEWVEDTTVRGQWNILCTVCGEILESEIRLVPVEGVELDQDYVETYYVRKAPAFTLTETVLPEDLEKLGYTVTWSSSNEKVATVDEDGNVTTHKRGEAVITVTVEMEDGTTFTDTCTVKVKYTFCQWLIWFFLLGCCWYFV